MNEWFEVMDVTITSLSYWVSLLYVTFVLEVPAISIGARISVGVNSHYTIRTSLLWSLPALPYWAVFIFCLSTTTIKCDSDRHSVNSFNWVVICILYFMLQNGLWKNMAAHLIIHSQHDDSIGTFRSLLKNISMITCLKLHWNGSAWLSQWLSHWIGWCATCRELSSRTKEIAICLTYR